MRTAFVAVALAVAAIAARPTEAGEPTVRRIVSTSPSITETLFALGLGDRVVGVSRYCRFPAEVDALPEVGTFLRPNVEAIARLAPDLVVVHTSSDDITVRLDALGLRYVAVERGGMEGVYSRIRAIGRAAGIPERAEALVDQIASRLAAIRTETRSRPPRRVLLIVGRRAGELADIVAVGRDTYLNDLLEIAGGTNVLDEPNLPEYPRISLETVIRRRPDVLIDTAEMGETEEERRHNRPANLALWRGNALVAATGIAEIHSNTTDALVVPGPRVVDAAAWLRDLIHPELAR